MLFYSLCMLYAFTMATIILDIVPRSAVADPVSNNDPSLCKFSPLISRAEYTTPHWNSSSHIIRLLRLPRAIYPSKQDWRYL